MSNVIRISEAASMALHAMVLLACEGEQRTLSSKKLASVLGRSEAHLSKVLQRLVKAGLIGSTRGPKGGFALKRPAGEISLLDTYEAIEGPLEETKCLLGQPICRRGKCILGDLLNKVDREAREYLSANRLSDLKWVLESKPE
jgi:Rrf2 family protein